LNLVAGNYLGDAPYLANMYARFHKRDGFEIEVVPGYLRLTGDLGQFGVLAQYLSQKAAAGNCSEAEKMLQALEKAKSSGLVIPDSIRGCLLPTP
jgi:hypothetical protein